MPAEPRASSSGLANSIAEAIEKARRELLDLSLRNRLLSCPVGSRSGLAVVEANSTEVFQSLVRERKPLSFAADWRTPGRLALGDGQTSRASKRSTDLQTRLESEQLERKLLRLHRDSRTLIEEQGINTLFLSLGFLHWTEEPSAKPRRAPLLLIPARLERKGVRSGFQLAYSEEDLGSNISLEAKLRSDFRIALPPLPDEQDIKPDRYFADVAGAVASQKGWSVEPNEIHLGFFSFSKLLMYRDLDPAAWPADKQPARHEVVSRLFGGGFSEPAAEIPHDGIDEEPETAELATILDADSSQLRTLLLARRMKRALVVQGPPGTGKSQTIANLIADAVCQGKTVLFVAEKLVALEVVKRRLDESGVGAACLELHSRAANRKRVLEDLRRTHQRGRPAALDREQAELSLLESIRRRLTGYARAVNREVGSTGVNPRRSYAEFRAAEIRAGRASPPLRLPEAASWTEAEFLRKRQHVSELDAALKESGTPGRNPFHGSRRTFYVATQAEELETVLTGLRESVVRVQAATREVASALALPQPVHLSEVRRLCGGLERLASVVDLRECKVRAPAWLDDPEALVKLIDLGAYWAKLRSNYASSILREAWGRDIVALRAEILDVGGSWLRFFNRRWHQARRTLAALFVGQPPSDPRTIVRLLDAIRSEKQLRQDLDSKLELYETAFDRPPSWESVDWATRRQQAAWLIETHRLRAVGAIPDWVVTVAEKPVAHLPKFHAVLRSALDDLESAKDRFVQFFDFEPEDVGLPSLDEWEFGGCLARIDSMLARPSALGNLARWNQTKARLRDHGLAPVANLGETLDDASVDLVAVFESTRYGAIIELAFRERPELAEFNRPSHIRAVEEFGRLDKLQFKIHQRRAALTHFSELPELVGTGRSGLLLKEMNKKTRHLPVRALLKDAGSVVQKIKPVFMMSPLSVAQFLAPGAVEFDIVIFDEASQIRAVDGVGALLRANKAVVVGDSKQLPPTDFFAAIADRDDEDEDETPPATADIESLLKLMEAAGARSEMLNWHYRSRHETLIAFSNRSFYDSRLNIFPSPERDRERLGLSFRHLPNTIYLRGKSARNLGEAEAVARAVLQHAERQRALPEDRRETLMVATFSAAQRDAIDDKIEELRRSGDAYDEFFAEGQEPFEVKNLENVQGDERDVVFISVGYGFDEARKLSQNFGPINRDGGERRLNVLCSRARRRCVVFANFRADDLQTGPISPAGLREFKRFLHFAEHGAFEVADEGSGETESEFEEQVRRALQRRGYTVEAQVGTAGYRIDLAVRDPARPGRYLIGIECDGARYHSAKSARDRDRLREEVLRGMGWEIYRIWSTAWFQDEETELRRVVEAIGEAQRAARAAEVESREAEDEPDEEADSWEPQPEVDEDEFEEEDGAVARSGISCPPYERASLDLPPLEGELHQMPPHRLAEWLVEVVRAEGPVHIDVASRRVASALGVQRRGGRIQRAFDRAASAAQRSSGIVRREDFLYPAVAATGVSPRDRSLLEPWEKSIAAVAPEEIDAAIRIVLTASHGTPAREVAMQAARLLGLGRTGKDIRAAIDKRIHALLRTGRVRENLGFQEWNEDSARDSKTQ